jgi:hypothetical protein
MTVRASALAPCGGGDRVFAVAAGEARNPTLSGRAASTDDFAGSVDPARTVLLLGAGASVPSGAPTAAQLAKSISEELRGRVVSEDLEELATILERLVGRQALVEAVRKRLKDLKPTGGLLALPEFPWAAIYTTNFDRLIEKAYRRVGRPLSVIRSNYDYAKLEQGDATPLFKIHGCISEDIVDGSHARLVLTEDDYAEYAKYRETLYARLGSDLSARDVLVIGQSLRDPHLQEQMREAARSKQHYGAPGRLLALVYEADPDRAALWEGRGFMVAFGDIDTLFRALTVVQPPEPRDTQALDDRLLLKPLMRTAAIDVDHALTLAPDPVRMFNGRAATYADIAAGDAFPRSALTQVVSDLGAPGNYFLSIVGHAGVGKTTLAREVLVEAARVGTYCWEHPYDFPLLADEWLDVDDQLRGQDQQGILLIDNCTPFLRQVNKLVSRLASREDPRLRMILTAAAAQWRPRMKDPALWKHGVVFELSTLSAEDIAKLVRLSTQNPVIRDLVDPAFAALPAAEKERSQGTRSRRHVCLPEERVRKRATR